MRRCLGLSLAACRRRSRRRSRDYSKCQSIPVSLLPILEGFVQAYHEVAEHKSVGGLVGPGNILLNFRDLELREGRGARCEGQKERFQIHDLDRQFRSGSAWEETVLTYQ
jgi:hypothetical protein